MPLTEIMVPFNINTDLIEDKLGKDAVQAIYDKVSKTFIDETNKKTRGIF